MITSEARLDALCAKTGGLSLLRLRLLTSSPCFNVTDRRYAVGRGMKQMSEKRWLQLDGIRGIAILAVLLFHISYEQVCGGGFLGVDLFFALSGFLITSLLVSELRRTGRINLRFFYTRRVLRLYPALVLSVLVAYFFWWPDRWSYFRMTLAVLTYGSNFWGGFNGSRINILGFAWSLSIEEQFYLVWPMLVGFFYTKVNRMALVFVSLVFILVATFTRYHLLHGCYSEILIYVGTFTRMDSIFAGSMGALLVDWYGDITQGKPTQRLLNTVLYPGFIAYLLFLQFGRRNAWMLHSGFTVVALLCTLVIALSTFLSGESLLYRALTLRPLRYFGLRSYGIYVYHGFILEATEHLRRPHSKVNLAVVTLLRVALILIVVEFSYQYVEKRFLRLKRRFEASKPRLSITFEDSARGTEAALEGHLSAGDITRDRI